MNFGNVLAPNIMMKKQTCPHPAVYLAKNMVHLSSAAAWLRMLWWRKFLNTDVATTLSLSL